MGYSVNELKLNVLYLFTQTDIYLGPTLVELSIIRILDDHIKYKIHHLNKEHELIWASIPNFKLKYSNPIILDDTSSRSDTIETISL